MINAIEDPTPPMETAETIKQKVATVLNVAPEDIFFTEVELKKLPVLQDQEVLSQLLDVIQYGVNEHKLDELCNALRSKESKLVHILELDGFLRQLMKDMKINPSGK